jgi:hypothetical protein
MASLGGPHILTDGLILALDAANIKSYPGSGTTWFDKSGFGTNGTLTNGPTFSSTNYGSISFDGVDDYTSLPNLSLNYPFNISFWAKEVTGNTAGPHITFSDPTQVGKSVGLGLFVTGGGVIRIYYYDNTFTSATTPASLNTIYHISGNFTSTGFDLYVNGVYKSTLTGAKSKVWTDTGTSYNVCRLNRVGIAYYGGSVYQVTMYNRALSAAEILQNYNATKGRFNL